MIKNHGWCGYQRESQERGRGGRVHQFVPGPVVASRRPCLALDIYKMLKMLLLQLVLLEFNFKIKDLRFQIKQFL